jgi:hypothetical protein
VVATTSRNYKLRLEGIASPPGQIPLRDLAEIGQALQLAATRIARQVVGAERPGRAPAFVDRVSEIRLTGLAEGSTVLELTLGDETALPLADSEEDAIAQRLEESFGAIAANRPPSWASPLVRESIGRLVARVEASGASEVTASWGANGSTGQQVIAVGQVDATVWKVDEEQETELVTMTGLLDKVDLRARRFRIHDDVGHDITLEDVLDLDTAARLIGSRVVARGVAERSWNRVARIVEPTLALAMLPDQWTALPPAEVPIGGVVPRGGISGVTSDEVDDFLAELRT